MALMLDEELDENVTTIKVIGVGGGGGNAVNRMVSDGLQGVEFIAMNTDQQALAKNHASVKVQLGSKLTKGRGAGADPEIGQRAAEESKDEIANALKGSQMVFITAGMGGGTGTGAAPVVAEVAHDLGILTVGIVTKPFSFEGKRKMGLAEQGIANLLMHVDSLIVIPNERLKMISQEKITLMNAFQAADNVLRQGVESISALMNVPAFINLDFADVRSIMKDAGYAHMGVGSAKGAGKAENAAKAAISSPLLETSIAGAHGVIINITSSAVKAPIDVLGLSNGARSGLTGFVAGVARSGIAAQGVTINNILPGLFDTDRLRGMNANAVQKTLSQDIGALNDQDDSHRTGRTGCDGRNHRNGTEQRDAVRPYQHHRRTPEGWR